MMWISINIKSWSLFLDGRGQMSVEGQRTSGYVDVRYDQVEIFLIVVSRIFFRKGVVFVRENILVSWLGCKL